MENLIIQILETIIGWTIIIFIIFKIVKRRKDNKMKYIETENKIRPDILEMGEYEQETNIQLYEKKDYLQTVNEYKFYKLLKIICNKYNLEIFCQVSLYALIKAKTYNEFNKIKAKTIDYVITDNNCKIKLCIELDDPTHIREDRQQRDKFIDELFNQLAIKIIRIPVQKYYNLQYIEEKIKESL